MSPGDSTLLFRAIPTSLQFSKQDQRKLARFASTLSLQIASGKSFSCLLTSNRALRKLNREFLGLDYSTDVLSFPLESEDGMGDIAISVEHAEAQAAEFGHTRMEEVRILMLHGLLHLIGYDHETDGGKMARAELKWRKHFALPQTLIARSHMAAAGSERIKTQAADPSVQRRRA